MPKRKRKKNKRKNFKKVKRAKASCIHCAIDYEDDHQNCNEEYSFCREIITSLLPQRFERCPHCAFRLNFDTADRILYFHPVNHPIPELLQCPDCGKVLFELKFLRKKKKGKCNHCKRKTKCRLCSRCGLARYCSKSCQKKAWPRHKIHCCALLSPSDVLPN